MKKQVDPEQSTVSGPDKEFIIGARFWVVMSASLYIAEKGLHTCAPPQKAAPGRHEHSKSPHVQVDPFPP